MPRSVKFLLLIVLLLGGRTALQAQGMKSRAPLADSGMQVFMFGAHLGYNIPGGDLNHRFGNFITPGGSLNFKTSSNWLFGLEYSFIYGENIKENPLDSIITCEGFLINGDGQLQDMRIQQQGHLVLGTAGYIFPLSKENHNSGLLLRAGVGYLWHKIKYYSPGGLPPQLVGNYIEGYDRLTSGLALTQSAGYFFLSPKNYLSFFVEGVVMEGFTKGRREWDYNLMRKDDNARLDMSYGIRAGVFIPLLRGGYSGKKSDNYYYY